MGPNRNLNARENLNRRAFLRQGFTLATAGSFLGASGLAAFTSSSGAADTAPAGFTRSDAKVALSRCPGYGGAVKPALAQCFDLLGGIGALMKHKTVTVKLNLTGTDFSPFLGRPVGETYMTHYDTVLALVSLLFDSGARRVRLVESTQSRAELGHTLALADWDVKALQALGNVELENTRNLGAGKSYAHLTVRGPGHMFSAFDLNHSYADTDVMISLAKLKNHITAGVTLSMKNLFGITPNALYGEDAGSEDATGGRSELHSPERHRALPGIKPGITSVEATWRVPRITTDICSARPIDLAIIDGISSVSGGEGPWCQRAGPMKVTKPGVLIAGLNPVSTDAVGTAVMGYPNPRARRGQKPFAFCDNHLVLAEQSGIGTADLTQIEVLGLPLAKARYPYG